jgi:hypothetical protein
VSYDYIGEDAYLLSHDGKEKAGKEEGTLLSPSDDVEKYSKVASSIGVRIVEGDRGELQHHTDDAREGSAIERNGEGVPNVPAPPVVEDVSPLYSKVNKPKKTDKDESPQDDSTTKESEEEASTVPAVEQLPPMKPDADNAEEDSHKDGPGGDSTVENLAGIDMLITDMFNSIKTAEEGGGASGSTKEKGGMDAVSGDISGVNMSSGATKAESDAPRLNDGSFYVNIDL